MPIRILKPTLNELPAYVDALHRGWGPDNMRAKASADEQLERIERDPNAFVKSLDDPEAKGTPVTLPDGSRVPRLPGFNRWIWDGEFCGSINFRWQNGTAELPPHVLGHIGYSVVPWKQGRGYCYLWIGPHFRPPLRGFDALWLRHEAADWENGLCGNGWIASKPAVRRTTAERQKFAAKQTFSSNPSVGRRRVTAIDRPAL